MPSSTAMVLNSKGTPAGFAHRLLHHRGELMQVGVAGHDVGVGVGDADEGFGEIAILQAGGPQQAAVPGAFNALLHGVRSHGKLLKFILSRILRGPGLDDNRRIELFVLPIVNDSH